MTKEEARRKLLSKYGDIMPQVFIDLALDHCCQGADGDNNPCDDECLGKIELHAQALKQGEEE